ncbi:MAG: hypothetical protein ACI9YL_000914 [Luteibaculaceae bacterium]|jgi:hypothetical protein
MYPTSAKKPPFFDHRAHLKLAFEFIQLMPLREAIEAAESFLLGYVTSVGARDQFNVTLTRASVLLISDKTHGNKGLSFDELLKNNPELEKDFLGELHQYYTSELLQSTEAKRTWIAPNLRNFNSTKELE